MLTNSEHFSSVLGKIDILTAMWLLFFCWRKLYTAGIDPNRSSDIEGVTEQFGTLLCLSETQQEMLAVS